MTNYDKKVLIINALVSYRGDDYARAVAAFRGMGYEEMQREHGESGITRQQLLDSYRKHADACDECIAYVKEL